MTESSCLEALCDLREMTLWPDSRTLEAVRDILCSQQLQHSLPTVACAVTIMFTLSNDAVALLDGCVAWSSWASVVIYTQSDTDLERNKFTLYIYIYITYNTCIIYIFYILYMYIEYILFCVRHSGKKLEKVNMVFTMWANNMQ